MSVLAVRRLRVTADDFGLTPGVTDGIIESHRCGIVTHTSVMASGLDFDRAMAEARGLPLLGVGVHLTLTWGLPALAVERVRSLVGPDGRFVGLGAIIRRAITQRLVLREVAEEWRAQIRKVTQSGVAPTHLDSHHHVHVIPSLLPLAAEVAREAGIDWLRRPREFLCGKAVPLRRMAARIILGAACLRRWPLPTSDTFRGVSLRGHRHFRGALEQMLRNLPAGWTELMVHPGKPDTALGREDAFVSGRGIELDDLCAGSVRQLIADVGIVLDWAGGRGGGGRG